MHRNRHGDDDRGHRAESQPEAAAVFRRLAVPQRHDLVEPHEPGGPSALPRVPGQDRHVRDHRHVEVQDATRQIRGDRDHVPEDRRLEPSVSEYVHDPVGAAHVDQHHRRADHQSEDGDCLRHAGNGPAPTGVGHPQDRGDERAGMADPDEEHEVRHVGAPRHVVPHLRHPEPVHELRHPCGRAKSTHGEERGDPEAPTATHRIERGQQVGFDGASVVTFRRYTVRGCPDHLAHRCSTPRDGAPFSASGSPGAG